MPIALDPKRTSEFVLSCDRKDESGKPIPKEKQTVFELRVLTARELAQLEDELSEVDMRGTIKVKAGSQVLKILKLGLVGWKNFKDGKGNEIQFQKDKEGVPREQNWNYLKQNWRREIADAITEQTNLTEEQLKN